jgi:hypothetical protein
MEPVILHAADHGVHAGAAHACIFPVTASCRVGGKFSKLNFIPGVIVLFRTVQVIVRAPLANPDRPSSVQACNSMLLIAALAMIICSDTELTKGAAN